MDKNTTAIISFLVPIAGIGIFLFNLKKSRETAFSALIWAMGGMALALVLLLAGTALRVAA
jgi:hypothetical protein